MRFPRLLKEVGAQSLINCCKASAPEASTSSFSQIGRTSMCGTESVEVQKILTGWDLVGTWPFSVTEVSVEMGMDPEHKKDEELFLINSLSEE